MAKSPKLDDYGGNAYGGRRRVNRSDDSNQSMRCDDCGKLQFVTRLELARASKPHCKHCGGLLVESISEAKRHKEKRVAVARTVDEDNKPKYIIEPGNYRCPHCGVLVERFKAQSLAAHLIVKHECMEEALVGLVVSFYFLDHSRVNVNYRKNSRAIFGTLYIEKCEDQPTTFPWAVRGLDLEGRDIIMARFKLRAECAAAIRAMENDRRQLDQLTVEKYLELLAKRKEHGREAVRPEEASST